MKSKISEVPHCNFLNSSVTLVLSDTNILLSILFSNSLKLFSSLRAQCSIPTNLYSMLFTYQHNGVSERPVFHASSWSHSVALIEKVPAAVCLKSRSDVSVNLFATDRQTNCLYFCRGTHPIVLQKIPGTLHEITFVVQDALVKLNLIIKTIHFPSQHNRKFCKLYGFIYLVYFTTSATYFEFFSPSSFPGLVTQTAIQHYSSTSSGVVNITLYLLHKLFC